MDHLMAYYTAKTLIHEACSPKLNLVPTKPVSKGPVHGLIYAIEK